MARTQQKGSQAEQLAEQYLIAQGLTPVARNHRCKVGEIDLIMRHRDALVFVEVRMRRSRAFGGPLASIDARKQRRIILAAMHYLQRTCWSGPCRFDAIGIDGANQIEWITAAFDTN